MIKDLEIQSYRGKYTVEFVDDCGATLSQTLKTGDQIIADQNVLSLYPRIAEAIENFQVILIEAKESSKSYEGVIPIIDEVINRGFTKKNRLIGIGGGIAQDITAFTASILLRGVDWIFYPTNLLAQCDSCIGSKTSINFREYKNQLGGFFPPKKIYVDCKLLESLPKKEIQSGLGEMLHYFLVTDEVSFEWMRDRIDRALVEPNILAEMVSKSLAIKKEMIELDEFDIGPRNVFNYGHSFGHALESTTEYSVPHGIAVSYGMDLATLISVNLGLVTPSFRNDVRSVLAKVWVETPLPEIDFEKFLRALSKDKKNEGSETKVILTKGYGEMFKSTLQLNRDTKRLIELFFSEKLYQKNM